MRSMRKRWGAVAGVAVLGFLLTGCGATSYMRPKTQTSLVSSGGTSPLTGTDTTTGNNTNIQDTTTQSPSYPPLMFQVDAVGYTSVSFNASVGKVLKVKFKPGIPNKVIPGTGYTANYTRLGVYITVGNISQPTAFLSNGLSGYPVETSVAMDFSTAFTSTCNSATNTSCRQTVTIKVEKPNYDYWCLFGYYCPWTHVENAHPWNGTLIVQTDDTSAI